MTQAEFDDLLSRPVGRAYAAGTAFSYSNLGYAILGRVVEAIVDRPFVDHVTSEVLRPLGLGETTYDYRTVPAGRLAPAGCFLARWRLPWPLWSWQGGHRQPAVRLRLPWAALPSVFAPGVDLRSPSEGRPRS